MSTTSPSRGKGSAVPAAGEALVQLLNSRPHAIHGDRLDDPDNALRIARHFSPEAERVSGATRERLREIRSSLSAIVEAPEDGASAWKKFTDLTSSVTLQHEFSAPDGVKLRQVSGDPIIGGLALDVAELVAAGSWSRLRFCAKETCEGAFYDTTRSRTQRWDSYDTCGNVMNVAAYRARVREADAG